MDVKTEIINYLSGPRDYNEGVALYSRYGLNLRLKKQFALNQTETSREILINELKKLAGLTDEAFSRLPRKAKPARHEAPALKNTTTQISKYQEAPESIKKAARFREKYSFLQEPDCPDELKILVADMFTALAKYKEAHAALQQAGDSAEMSQVAAACKTIVENYLQNNAIWDELNYYKEHGQILGNHPIFHKNEVDEAEDLTAMSDVDLMGRLRSAQVQESKQKAKVAAAKGKKKKNERAEASLAYWSARKEELKAELERRKKK